MRIEYIRLMTEWKDVYDSAMTTVNKDKGHPSKSWVRKMLIAEHSPIRQFVVKWKWVDLPYWVSVHLVRHNIGIEHYVSTQRPNKDRSKAPQSFPVSHECVANAQAIINISRKRLCNKAALETREAWKMFLDSLYDVSDDLFMVCVPECIYRGFCPEFNTCGLKLDRSEYLSGIKTL